LQEFRSSGVAGVAGVQEFRSSGVQEFRSSGVQEFRSSGVQEFRSRIGVRIRKSRPPLPFLQPKSIDQRFCNS